jgi:hypothetical protein
VQRGVVQFETKSINPICLIPDGNSTCFCSALQVQGQSQGLVIAQITDQGGTTALDYAEVGQDLTLYGTLYTENGAFKVYFGNTLIGTGTADGYEVASNFTVPDTPSGEYIVFLEDVALGQNTTMDFDIILSYIVNPVLPQAPEQIVEGGTVNFDVTITGGIPNYNYGANVTVVLPEPLNTNYIRLVTVTTSSMGTAHATVSFPSSDFSPSDSSTLYSGRYTVYVNKTQGLAEASFPVGFTDKTQYHRQDVVTINAAGYQPNQVCTVSIQLNNAIIDYQTITASAQGVVAGTWAVPSDATLGIYTATITPQTTPSKAIADVQSFTIAGYAVAITAVNLAGDIVPGILLEATDETSGAIYNQTTNTNGIATISLEKGTTSVSAFWNGVNVGTTQVTVNGNTSSTITCQLTNLVIKVQDKNGAVIPLVNLNITFQYTPRSGSTQSASMSAETGVSGTYTFSSVLTGISYNIVASKYGVVFNNGNSTTGNLAVQSSSSATIICPDETITLSVVDYNNAPIANVRVSLIEQASGVFYSVTTDSSGNAQAQVTFGQYRATVYTSSNILLSDSTVDALNSGQVKIQSDIYNLPVSVKVVDYFGNPISGATVQLSRLGMNDRQATTQGNGVASFDNVIGGNMEITAYASGNQGSYVSQSLVVDSPSTVQVKMDQYVAFGGAVIDASLLAAILIIVVVALLIVVVEVFKKVGFKLRRHSD